MTQAQAAPSEEAANAVRAKIAALQAAIGQVIVGQPQVVVDGVA